jgi:hypothetical protein
MYVSPEKSTWTVLQFIPESKIFCAVSSGYQFKPAEKRFETTEPSKKKDIPS